MTNHNDDGGHNGHTGLDLVQSLRIRTEVAFTEPTAILQMRLPPLDDPWWADFRRWHRETHQRADAMRRHVRVAAVMLASLAILLVTALRTPLFDGFMVFYYLFFLGSLFESRRRQREMPPRLLAALADDAPAHRGMQQWVARLESPGLVALGGLAVFQVWLFADSLGRLLTWHP